MSNVCSVSSLSASLSLLDIPRWYTLSDIGHPWSRHQSAAMLCHSVSLSFGLILSSLVLNATWTAASPFGLITIMGLANFTSDAMIRVRSRLRHPMQSSRSPRFFLSVSKSFASMIEQRSKSSTSSSLRDLILSASIFFPVSVM
ncbi:MAG: hypothetical protein E7Z70_07210 [Thermoplasmata archaeon]|nr:hypothetical protein [Thermoplasmata archaeon]